MYTKEEQDKLTELMESNEDFAYFINKTLNDCKLLTSQISHELRNPLTLIKSTAQLIETEQPEVKAFKHWAQLMEDINSMADLLMQLSLYNNSEKINKNEQDLLLVIKSVIHSFESQAVQSGIELSLTIAESDIPYYLSYPLDQIKFKQVLMNLIGNAFDATQKGNYIHVECKVSNPSHLIIAVHDNGKAIPADELAGIFEPFVTYKPGGTGLGLAISSKIVGAHNGNLSAESSEEKTSFIIRLPLISQATEKSS